MQFFDLSTKEKTMAMDSLSKVVEKHLEKVMKLDRDNLKKSSQSQLRESRSLETKPNLTEKTVSEPLKNQTNIIFPVDAMEAFHKAQSEKTVTVRSPSEGLTRLAGANFNSDSAKATSKLQTPAAVSKVTEELKKKVTPLFCI